jgi:hypothetical protein
LAVKKSVVYIVCEEVVDPILELSVVEGNSAQIVRERAEEVVIRWGKVRRVGQMWKNLSVEFPNGCVFTGLLPPDGEIVDNSVQQ